MSRSASKVPVVDLRRIDFRNDFSSSEPFTALILAPRGSGKSYIIKEILHAQRNRFYYGIFVNKTENGNKFFSSMAPKKLVKTEYKDRYPMQLMQRGNSLIDNGIGKVKRQTVLVVDDALNDLKNSCRNMAECFFNGRHFDISIVLTTQYCSKIPSEWRENCDYVFIGALRGRNSLEAAYRTVESVFPSFALFRKYVSKYVRNYNFLAVRLSQQPGTNNYDAQSSCSSVNSVQEAIDIIKQQCFIARADVNRKTKILPDVFRTDDEVYQHYSSIGKTVRKDSTGQWYVLDKNRQWVSL